MGSLRTSAQPCRSWPDCCMAAVLHIVRPDNDEPEFYRVWSDEEPGTYDPEQHVMSFLLTAQD